MAAYRVIIIDDEEIIVRGLQQVVDWAGHGCQVVATANSASSGAEAIRQYKPHIVFTDINMPDGTGLAMLAGIRSEFPDMQIAVLTGFGSLEYAQEAIKLGVTRFLQKPSRMDDIYEALDAMTAKLRGTGVSPQEPQNAPAKPVDVADASTDVQPDETCHSRQFIVLRAMEYIEAHYSEKIALQDVADYCYVTTFHLSKVLNKDRGQSFYNILNAVRIRHCTELLRDPSLRISDICEMTGFSDMGHFSKVFKRVTGLSAAEYRDRLQQ